MRRTMDAPPVQYVTTSDGFRLAYSVTGKGLPWVVVPAAHNHIQLMWRIAGIAPWLNGLAERFTLVQLDGRGQGLSTRGLPETYSQYDRVTDLEVVVDHLELAPAVLLAVGSAVHAAIRFAARRPDRVHALVLMGGAVTSAPWSPAMYYGLASGDWETFLRTLANSRQALEEPRITLGFLKRMTTQADFVQMASTWTKGSSVQEEVTNLRSPALVLHLPMMPREVSAELAASFARGSLVSIPDVVTPWMFGNFDVAIGYIEDFLRNLSAEDDTGDKRVAPSSCSLSHRETEVLHLVAQGKSNQQIANELVISLHTVKRHVSNVFHKTGVTSRAQAIVYAHDHGLS